MKELLEKVLRHIPRDLIDLGAVLSGPKRFVAQRLRQPDEAFVGSLTFLGLSCAVTAVATASLLQPNATTLEVFAQFALLALLAVSLDAVALRIAWRIVGGTARVSELFTVYAYYSGAVLVLIALIRLAANGVFKLGDPETYDAFTEAWFVKSAPFPDVLASKAFVAYLCVWLVGHIGVAAWILIGWGAYRNLNGLSKRRSAIALLLMAPLTAVGTAIAIVVGAAMSR